MKKIIALLLAMSMCFALAACGNNTEKPVDEKPSVENTDPTPAPAPDPQPENTDKPADGEENTGDAEVVPGEDNPTIEDGNTVATALLEEFKEKAATMTAEEMANTLITNSVIKFDGGVVPVEPGYLAGFANEITGFKSGYMFAPMIGTIPFVGYIFELEEGADVATFEKTLDDNYNLRWNICTTADDAVMYTVNNLVMFVMSPSSFETATPDADGAGDTTDVIEEGTETTEVPAEGTEPAEGDVVADGTETPTDGTEPNAEASEAPVENTNTDETPADGETTTDPAA